MLSPDDCCKRAEDVKQQVSTHGESNRASENSQEAMIIGEVITYPVDPPDALCFENDDDETSQSSSSTRAEKNVNVLKFGGVSKHPKKRDLKRTLMKTMCRSGNKKKLTRNISRQNMLNCIHILQNTVKKQQKIIKYLKLKLEKLECHGESKCVQNKVSSPFRSATDNVTHTAKNSEFERGTLLHGKIDSTKLQRGVSDLLNQKSARNMQYSFRDILSENVGDAKKDRDTQVCLSQNKESLSRDDGQNSNVSTGSERLMCNDEVTFIENNLEVQIIESDSKVHLHSDELNSKNTDIDEFDEEVKKCIEKFMLREDVSVTDLNVRLREGEKVTRFRRHFLGVLYKQFHAEVSSKCSFSQFCKYIPQNVVKPTPTYWKMLVCSRCENTELKFMEIINKVLLRKDLPLEEVLSKQDLYERVSQELSKLRNSQKPFTYTTWAKTLLGKMEASERIVTTTVGSACTDILKELDLLKEHLIRCYNQYEAVREAREETEMSPIHAMVHIDWYESPATFVARHLHTSYYYGDGFKSLHAGFVRTQGKSYGFASLSDCRDHTAPAVWASINDILVSLAKEGMKVITVVSDSATAQYRNKGNFYLMRRFARQNNVEMKWIYLEGGHGKGVADAIGASIKHIMCDTIGHNPNKSFRNTMDILPIIKDLTPIKLFTHTDQLVQQYKNLLSRQHLQVIPSTYKIHEVCVKETSFYVKESSADKLPFFSLDTQVKGSLF